MEKKKKISFMLLTVSVTLILPLSHKKSSSALVERAIMLSRLYDHLWTKPRVAPNLGKVGLCLIKGRC